MRILIGAVGLALLAGCTTPGDLLKSTPTIVGETSKTPKAYALCVLPGWQEHQAGVTMNETLTGYRLISSAESIGQTNELLEIKQNPHGSEVKLYQRMPSISIGRSKITSSVKKCL
ncbi:hypothetical protein N5K35_31785 [Pseudomonas sp. GD03651]|uniref:hypothetical protein n=1 Tax=Pseudomonas TaxID=286 RepID=UPI00034EDCDB|nr:MULTISPECIES: hypothetical protein [Pseudomonas]AGN82032.1 hypothetical protein L483_13260 [Pseudomonas putida H8234]MDH2188250.1 hypothetical protein [Pseudomonas sp. GD03651]HDS1815123.1 hypothetical protein [Pseudomonas putida]HDS3812173.1 hypothetical protein [Pseudomonas putida]